MEDPREAERRAKARRAAMESMIRGAIAAGIEREARPARRRGFVRRQLKESVSALALTAARRRG